MMKYFFTAPRRFRNFFKKEEEMLAVARNEINLFLPPLKATTFWIVPP